MKRLLRHVRGRSRAMMVEDTAGTSGPVDLAIRCPDCDYNLTGAPSDRCPSCGWIINVDVLVAAARQSSMGRRVAVVITCVVVGAGSVLAGSILLLHGKRLTLLDGVSLLAILVGAAGHLLLAGAAALRRSSWPLRRDEVSNIASFSAWLSILMGIAGASQALWFAPTTLVNLHGVRVNGFFEFVLTAFCFSLPGITLLLMCLISFRAGNSLFTPGAHPRSVADTPSTFPTPFLLEAWGRYTPEQLTQQASEAARPTTPSMERAITEAWDAEMALARESDKSLFNGRIARLVRADATASDLRLELGTTSYRELVGTHYHPAAQVRRAGPQYFAHALGVSVLVITHDGYVVLGRRGSRVAYHAGYLHTFGGMLEAADRRTDGSYDIVGGALRELREELGVGRDAVTNLIITGLVRDADTYQPEILLEATLKSRRGELEAAFDHALEDSEHSGIECVYAEPEAIVPFLQGCGSVTPVAHAALLLYGRHRWGAGWYEQACFRLYGGLPEFVKHAVHSVSG